MLEIMAALTAYQQQFRQRAKKTIQRRADADRKVRAYARLLAAALGEASETADAVELLNKTYRVGVSAQTALVKVLTEVVGAELLGKVLAENPAGEESALFNQISDANRGQPLAADAKFGERVTAGTTKRVSVEASNEEESARKQTVPKALPADLSTEV